MAKYLTVAQYKRFSDGIALGTVSDMVLAYTISRAEADIDAHMGFNPRHGGFEPHSVMLQHAFDQRTRKTQFPEHIVPIRNIQRYRIQVSNVTTSGAGFFANISAGDCVINNDGEYVEIVPLQAVTYALSPVLLQLGLDPPIVEMDCNVGFYLANFGETLIDSSDEKTYYSVDGFWAASYDAALAIQPNTLPPVPPVIYKNGVVVASGYTVNYTEGSVTFSAANAVTDVITVDYTKTIPDFVQEAAIFQVSHLLATRQLNALGLYRGLWQIRNGDQSIAYPRTTGVAEQGRAQQTPLCPEAAAALSHYEGWAIA